MQMMKSSMKSLMAPVKLLTAIAVRGNTANSYGVSTPAPPPPLSRFARVPTNTAKVVAAMATPRNFHVVLSVPAASKTYEEKVMAFDAETCKNTQSFSQL